MAVVIVKKVPPYSGEYDLDLTFFTLGELARIQDIAHLRPVALTDALLEEDPRLRVAMAVVAIERGGRRVEWLEPFWLVRPDDLTIDYTRGPGVPEDIPPTGSPLTSENGSGETEKTGSSGPLGSTDGDSSPESDPSATGSRGSESTSE